MKHKYVRHSSLGFALWPADTDLYHAHMAATMRKQEPHGTVMSAGFAEVEKGTVRCFGRSESLSLGGLPDDTATLARQLNLIAVFVA